MHATPRTRVRLALAAAVAALLALYAGMALSAARAQGPTFDELYHITGGWSLWQTGDHRLHPEHGNLAQRWATLPLLAAPPRFPPLDQPAWQRSDFLEIGHQFFFTQGNDVMAMVLAARGMVVLFGAALGLVVFAWARALFGSAGGLLALALFAFCPTLLAHGALATSDMGAALFFTLATWCGWRLLHRINAGTVLACACACSGLLLAKMSWVILLPVAALLLLVRLADGRPLPVRLRRERLVTGRARQLAAVAGALVPVAALVLAAIWCAYGWRFEALRDAVPGRDSFAVPWEELLQGGGPLRAAVRFARAHHLLPEAYVYGFTYVLGHAQYRSAFMNGAHSMIGWPGFFPFALLAKTPPAVFGMLALALAALLVRRRAAAATPGAQRAAWREGLYQTAPIWVFLAVYWAFALTSRLNIGHRHILPTYPLLYVLAGGAAAAGAARVRARVGVAWGALIAVLLAWHAADSLRVRPHYLAYFSAPAGGPAGGYRLLVDSSLDWGQGLPALQRWLARELPAGPARPPVYLSYVGSAEPDYFGITATRLPGYYDHWHPADTGVPTGGVYCVSATMLQQVYPPFMGRWCEPYEQAYWQGLQAMRALDEAEADPAALAALVAEHGAHFVRDQRQHYAHLRWARLCAFLRQREPDAHIGYAILIYRLTDADVHAALFGPPAELLPQIAVRGLRMQRDRGGGSP